MMIPRILTLEIGLRVHVRSLNKLMVRSGTHFKLCEAVQQAAFRDSSKLSVEQSRNLWLCQPGYLCGLFMGEPALLDAHLGIRAGKGARR